jgi:hypothetical protein
LIRKENPRFHNADKSPMQETVPVISELAVLADRAKRASETTMQLVREYRLIVAWFALRPRSRRRPYPTLDQTKQEPASDDPLTVAV